MVYSEWRTNTSMVLQEVGISALGNNLDIERIYHEIFTSPDASMYQLSARIARHLLSGDQISGILYPSIALRNASQNVALQTRFVDGGLRLVNASLCDIKSVTNRLEYEFEEIDFALPRGDGGLDWKGRRRQWVLKDELRAVSNGSSWDLFNASGGLVDPE